MKKTKGKAISQASKPKRKLDLAAQIQNKLKTVYDPEFPIIDIYTLGLIYSIKVSEKEKKINILMTFTTPFCPMADMIQEMIKNAVKEVVPTFEITTTVTFSPAWNYDMIKDKDLKKMFE